MTIVESYPVSIYLAGYVADARRSLRSQCFAEGLCVTVTMTTFIYTAGEEEGVCVGLINYPRFPKTPQEIWDRAVKVALTLRKDLYQKSVLVQSHDRTEWFTTETES